MKKSNLDLQNITDWVHDNMIRTSHTANPQTFNVHSYFDVDKHAAVKELQNMGYEVSLRFNNNQLHVTDPSVTLTEIVKAGV